ncbi:hypothetical protein PHMEG_00029524 [Phytophthora megakarya]|uniref:Bzip transcription factor n=1 Tax=Phytophthora megakarya TaxID=4795 RepID=A0A225V3Z0_9STRA|nr:hypothetical protein PHMEG_00029524 [Phytophthora megakarya]
MLRDEIDHLKSQRNSLLIGIPTHITLQSVVQEYFRVFRNGFIKPDGSRIAELDFLRLSMAPDLQAGSVVGFEKLARNWGIFSQFFEYVRVQLVGIEQTTSISSIVKTVTSVTVSATTLRYVFLCPDDVEQEIWSNVTAKLLGQRLIMHGTIMFSWNSLTNRVDRIISQANMVSPLLRLLGNIEDLTIVLNNARVTPEGNLVVGDYLTQYPLYR